jgi:hypothetical protein
VAKKHPDKDIQEAIAYALSKNWRMEVSEKSAHAWGRLKCPETSRMGCIISVWSTPRVAKNHARQIVQAVDKCEHS